MITPVWSASKSPPIQRLQNPTAGSTQPDQNDPKAQCQPNELLFQQHRPNSDISHRKLMHCERVTRSHPVSETLPPLVSHRCLWPFFCRLPCCINTADAGLEFQLEFAIDLHRYAVGQFCHTYRCACMLTGLRSEQLVEEIRRAVDDFRHAVKSRRDIDHPV